MTIKIIMYLSKHYVYKLIKGAPREDPRKGREEGKERDFFKPTRLTVQPTWGELL